jgi:exodeoxyribonuclease III
VLGETKTKDALSILCWNVGNPSIERAGKQVEWLCSRPEDMFVLTEVKNSEGCMLLERHFKFFLGCDVMFQKPDANEYGVMIISKTRFVTSDFCGRINYLRPRVASVRLALSGTELEVIGLYVPTKGFSQEKAERKKTFIEEVVAALDASPLTFGTVLCGDLNILEPDHFPRYPDYQDWEYAFYSKLQDSGLKDAFRQLHPEAKEYSWVGRSNDGYRFDHSFVSSDLLPKLKDCRYLHETRESGLSDHSALVTEFLSMKES